MDTEGVVADSAIGASDNAVNVLLKGWLIREEETEWKMGYIAVEDNDGAEEEEEGNNGQMEPMNEG